MSAAQKLIEAAALPGDLDALIVAVQKSAEDYGRTGHNSAEAYMRLAVSNLRDALREAVRGLREAGEPMSDQQATLLNQAHDMLLEHADEQRKRGNDSAAAGAECSAAVVLELGAAWAAAERQQPSTAPQPAQDGGEVVAFDLVTHLRRQMEFSARTFGPGDRTAGVCDHIRKELREVQDDAAAGVPTLPEWVDVILLALDGAWRSGATPEQIAEAINAKQARNEGRVWPDWRTAEPGKAIEHDRSHDTTPASAPPAVDPPAPAAALEVVLTDEVLLQIARDETSINVVHLTRESGPYEVTKPTHVYRQIANAIARAAIAAADSQKAPEGGK